MGDGDKVFPEVIVELPEPVVKLFRLAREEVSVVGGFGFRRVGAFLRPDNNQVEGPAVFGHDRRAPGAIGRLSTTGFGREVVCGRTDCEPVAKE